MAPDQTPVSVVISTLNRPESLQRTLLSLQYQRYRNFEVIVVEGPSSQPADQIVAWFGGAVRYLRCPEPNLSKSRNVGISAAAGELIAFIDDDAVPETRWLDQLVAAYDAPHVGGTGGIVYDYTGTRLQYLYSRSDRVGRTSFNRRPLEDEENLPGASVFPYLQGTNMSFRRELLAEVGGFDEEIEYNFDEVEVCLRLIDAGHPLRALDGARVYHKYLPSGVRNAQRVFTDPFLSIKNRVYFALRYGLAELSIEEVLGLLRDYVRDVRTSARSSHDVGQLDQRQLDFFLNRVDEGFGVGLRAGLEGDRKHGLIPDPEPDAFKPYARREPDGGRLTVCFLSQEFPPHDFGGVGRYTSELASGFADEGHEVHVFTRSPDELGTLDFEAGCWVHRTPAIDKHVPELLGNPAAGNLYLLAANHHEVTRLAETAPIDLVSAPLWLCEGLVCSLDPATPTVTTLVTSMKTIAGLHPSWRDDPHPQAMLRLERETLRHAVGLHAISQAILEQVTGDYGDVSEADRFVVPLGLRDRAPNPLPRVRQDGGLTVLFVGRLEVRKGVDVLLESIRRLLPELEQVRFVLAGSGTMNTETGETYREAFEREFRALPQLGERVEFLGHVDEDRLWELYRDCDIFCAPSRFESFGLVLLEAMMFGKPVVACDTGGMPEIVVDEQTGLLAAPADADALTERLRRLLTDAPLRRRLGAAARERFVSEFELSRVVAKTLGAYGLFAHEHSRRPSDQGALRREFADVIAATAQISEAEAASAAAQLMDPETYPIDVRGELLRAWPRDPREFVTVVYEVLLRRTPAEDEFELWLGGSAQPGWRLDVVGKIARSTEAESLGVELAWLDELEREGGPVADHKPIAAAIAELNCASAETLIEGLYRALLGRPADPVGVASWSGALATGLQRSELAAVIAASPEGRAKGLRPRRLLVELGDPDPSAALVRAAATSDEWFVRTVYAAVLDREAEPTGLAGALSELEEGLSRREFAQRVATSEEGCELGNDEWQAALEQAEFPPGPSAPPATPSPKATARRGVSVARRSRSVALAMARQPRAINALGGELRGVGDSLRSEIGGLSRAVRAADAHDELRELRRELAELHDAARRLANASAQPGGDADRQSLTSAVRIAGSSAVRGEQAVKALAGQSDEMVARLRQLEQTVDVLRRKQEAVSLDLREQLGERVRAVEPAPPRIVDPAALERRVQSEGAIRLNLGCGEKPLPHYVNVDFRELPEVDVIADVRELPFDRASVDEIASSHLVEHFRQHQLETVILPYWRSLLRPGGIVRIICPNWEAMLDRVNDEDLSFADFKTVTFGLQDYEGDDHFAMYSPQTLSDILVSAGFASIEIVDPERRNGMSTEMEVIAHAPQDADG